MYHQSNLADNYNETGGTVNCISTASHKENVNKPLQNPLKPTTQNYVIIQENNQADKQSSL